MLVYGAQLCSSLTVTKLTVPVTGLADEGTGLVSGQLSGATGLACSQGGAAYTNWIKVRHLLPASLVPAQRAPCHGAIAQHLPCCPIAGVDKFPRPDAQRGWRQCRGDDGGNAGGQMRLALGYLASAREDHCQVRERVYRNA